MSPFLLFFRIPFEVLVHLELCDLKTFEKVLNVRITQSSPFEGLFPSQSVASLVLSVHSFFRELVFG